jgi:hypothetical protein
MRRAQMGEVHSTNETEIHTGVWFEKMKKNAIEKTAGREENINWGPKEMGWVGSD